MREHAKAVRLYDNVVVLHLPEPELSPRSPRGRGEQGGEGAFCWLERETDEALTEGIPTYRACYRVSPIPKTSYLLYLWSALRAVRRIAQDGFQPDVIHAHIYEAGVPATLIGRWRRVPVVVTEQFSAFPRRLLTRQELWKAKLAFRWADRVLPVSFALQGGIEQYGIHARFQRVPNVVDTGLFSPPPGAREGIGPIRMLFVGSLIPLKGVTYLLEALGQVDRTWSGHWILDLVGDGPEKDVLQRQAAELGLSDRTVFHGLKTKAQVAESMQRADLFVFPSQWDNMPCVIVEAMSSGLPIVSTKTGGIPEMVEPDTGILVPPGDADALAQALIRMLGTLHEFDRETIARNAQEKYSLAAVGQILDTIYRDCMLQ